MLLRKSNISPFLTQEIYQKLENGKIRTVLDFTRSDLQTIIKLTNLDHKVIKEIKELMYAQFALYPTKASILFEDMLIRKAVFSTGCSKVNQLLNGGIYSGDVTEIIGPPAAGKTQFCLSLMVQVALLSKQTCFYIDTNGGVTASRILEICNSTGTMQRDIYLFQRNNIKYSSIHDIYDLFTILEQLRSDLNKQITPFYYNLRLIVIDSINPLLSPFLGGNQTTAFGLKVQLGNLLKYLSSEYSLAVIVTNNSICEENSCQFKAALGFYWQHVPNTRILIRKMAEPFGSIDSSSRIRDVTLLKNTRSKTGQTAKILITEKGIEDFI